MPNHKESKLLVDVDIHTIYNIYSYFRLLVNQQTLLFQTKMLQLAILTIFLLGSSLASPVEHVEDADTDSGIKAIFSLFSQISGVVQKTGIVISRLNEKYTNVPELAQAGRKVTINKTSS